MQPKPRRRPYSDENWGVGVARPVGGDDLLLVVDAGNTNIVFAVHDGSSWRGIWRIRTDAQRTSDEYAVWLLTLLQHARLKPAQVGRAVIGTVVPAALYHLRRLCRDWFNVEPLVARSNLDWGFEIRVDTPTEVGADRLLNALAAHQRYRGPLTVIDFGTATTFDVVGAERGPIWGAPSRQASICRWRRCIPPPPACRASASAGRRR